MNIDIKRVKIVVTVPPENTADVRNAICNEGAGIIGNYTHCSMITKCIGTSKPKLSNVDDDKNLTVADIIIERNS